MLPFITGGSKKGFVLAGQRRPERKLSDNQQHQRLIRPIVQMFREEWSHTYSTMNTPSCFDGSARMVDSRLQSAVASSTRRWCARLSGQRRFWAIAVASGILRLTEVPKSSLYKVFHPAWNDVMLSCKREKTQSSLKRMQPSWEPQRSSSRAPSLPCLSVIELAASKGPRSQCIDC